MMSAVVARAFASPLRVTSSSLVRSGPSCLSRVTPALRPAWATHHRSFSKTAFCQEKVYTDQHEWVESEPNSKLATIGITNYAAEALGDVVFVELPAVDQEVAAGDTIGAVESVKSASDIMSPVSGTIVEANNDLAEKPKLANDAPEAEGWFAKIEMADTEELKQLMDKEAYARFISEEAEH